MVLLFVIVIPLVFKLLSSSPFFRQNIRLSLDFILISRRDGQYWK